MGFAAFFHAMEYWWGNLDIFQVMTYTTELESDEKKAPIHGKKGKVWLPISSDFSHRIGLAEFSKAMKNLRKDSDIFYLMKFDDVFMWKAKTRQN